MNKPLTGFHQAANSVPASWFNKPAQPGDGPRLYYLERYLNYGLTRARAPIRQSRSSASRRPATDLSALQIGNHLELAPPGPGGHPRPLAASPWNFRCTRSQETGKAFRPAALDSQPRLSWTGRKIPVRLTPLDGVVLTTGCDKTTPCLPEWPGGDGQYGRAIVLSGGADA